MCAVKSSMSIKGRRAHAMCPYEGIIHRMYRDNRSKGMILVLILLFITLMDALVLAGFALVEEAIRLSRNFYAVSKQNVDLHLILKTLYPLVSKVQLTCVLPKAISSSDWLQKTDDWWFSSETCFALFPGVIVRYAIETLDSDPCAVFNLRRGVQYFRVTLKVFSLKNKESMPLTQMTFAQSSSIEQPCKSALRILSDTWQSWREL